MILVDPAKRCSPNVLLQMVNKYQETKGSSTSVLVGLRCGTSEAAEREGRDAESGHARKRYEDHVKGRIRRRLAEGPGKDAGSWQ